MNVTLTRIVASSLLMLMTTAVQAAIPANAKLYKNPSCGCCDDYAEHLERQGIEVEIIETQAIGDIKESAGIPYGQGSCHTTLLGDYVIEGHVPFAAIERLFEDQPDIDGIGLAGMPSGTPGMPGPQQAPYEVYRFSEGKATPYLSL
ncbi:DUF411 domain-containing protein [Litchfieldella xinjiangensis]|uniref:DUF411 domain-containing protein n=1 Tax=Litchfieldella xinjiangensis TaxID=1166948 RepID=UPI0005BC72A3|nr:DUF411 domain-containing protein [Halomonas xinjiangensis]